MQAPLSKKYFLGGLLVLATTGVQAADTMPPLPTKQLQAVKTYQAHIQAALKIATPKKADKLLIQYTQKLPVLIEKVAQADDKFLREVMVKHLKTHKNDENHVIHKSSALKAREKELAKYGLKYQYHGVTGHGFLTPENSHYSQLFGKKVSPAVKAYLTLRDKFIKEDLFYDNEMVMDYAKVGERVAAWERYLNKFGDTTPLLNHAKCEYIVQQSAFLTGSYNNIGITGILANRDDSPTPKREKLKPEVRKAWADYQKKYPQSASSSLIAKMPKTAPFQAPAEKIVADYHKNVGLNKLTPKVCEKLWF